MKTAELNNAAQFLTRIAKLHNAGMTVAAGGITWNLVFNMGGVMRFPMTQQGGNDLMTWIEEREMPKGVCVKAINAARKEWNKMFAVSLARLTYDKAFALEQSTKGQVSSHEAAAALQAALAL